MPLQPFLATLLCLALAGGCSEHREPLPRLGQVPNFALTDQTGKPVQPQSFPGRPWLVAFFFTRCPSVCPRITAKMKEVRALVPADKLQLVSISVDPENDSPEVLRAYAREHGATEGWAFLTGPYRSIADTAEQGFKIGLAGHADPSKPDLGITHGSHLILVDPSGQIRGYYRSFDDDVVSRLVADLERL